MDPTATIDRLRELVMETSTAETNEHKADLADEMAALIEGLDNWLCRFGHLPAQWDCGKRPGELPRVNWR